MARFRRIFFVAALAGLLAGLFVTALHQVGTVPVILKAEVYEQAADTPAAPDHAAATAHDHDHDHDSTAWEPQDGLERTGRSEERRVGKGGVSKVRSWRAPYH